MKMLFSPSEAKEKSSSYKGKLQENLCFKDLHQARDEVLEKYNHILTKGSFEQRSKMLGLKKESEINEYAILDAKDLELETALLRYSGVGYKYLDFSSLEDKDKQTALENIFIFSNLLGIIKGSDKIPFYKLKQGEKIDGFDTAKFYKKALASRLDEELKDEFIIDLRAGYYEKFYTPKKPYVSMKFLKNGKTVSHFAKAYRGIAARAICIYKPQNEEEFKQMPIPDLHINQIQIKGKKTTYIYDIIA